MHRRRAIIGLAIVFAVGITLALFQVPLRPWCSMTSLRRVNDLPLYVMHIYGDYGFGVFLQHGVSSDSVSDRYSGAAQAWACTVFAAMGSDSECVLGRNFDWHNRQTLLLFTDPPDGYASASMVDMSYLQFSQDGATWADRRRLLDAPYWPFDGMNERGLAIGMMAVEYARDKRDPSRPTIGSLHAIRLMLDYAANVEQAIALLGQYNVDFGGGPPVHYLVADASGKSAVIEYIDGTMAVRHNDQLWQVSTNFVLHDVEPKGASSPCWRYNRTYEALAQNDGNLPPVLAMSLLEDVSQSNTMWSVVYGTTSGDILVAVDRQYAQLRPFALKMRPRGQEGE